jgi:uncharacterized protein YoxC
MFFGYARYKHTLLAPSQSSIEPFIIVLVSLIKQAKNSQQFDERANITMDRIQRALTGFAKEEIAKMAAAIIEDIAKKAGLEQTFKVAKGFWSRFKAQKTNLMSAEENVAKYRDQALQSYVGIFRSLAKEFEKRRFVLIFDQFYLMYLILAFLILIKIIAKRKTKKIKTDRLNRHLMYLIHQMESKSNCGRQLLFSLIIPPNLK